METGPRPEGLVSSRTPIRGYRAGFLFAVILLAAVVVGLTVVGVFALAEWSMNQKPIALYALLPLLLVGAGAYVLAFVGQGFASEEMDELRAFLDQALDSEAALPSHIRHLRPAEPGSATAAPLGRRG